MNCLASRYLPWKVLEEKRAIAAAGAADKAKWRAEDATKQLDRGEQAKFPPVELFRIEIHPEWDEQGIPIRDAKGDEIIKNFRKIPRQTV